jgi:hypothetical protein
MTANFDRLPSPPSGDFADPLVGFLDRLRDQDPAFAKASVLYDDEMGEWQAAVYLLTGCEPVWKALGAAVIAERSMVPVFGEIFNAKRAWTANEGEAMAWAAHFWDARGHRANFPSSFQGPLFDRWITALHLRQGRAPAGPQATFLAALDGPGHPVAPKPAFYALQSVAKVETRTPDTRIMIAPGQREGERAVAGLCC